MSSDIRFFAAVKREAQWAIDDHVPDEMKTDGCDHCYMGWVNGPGLLYRCQCNLTEGEDYFYEEEKYQRPVEIVEKQSMWTRFKNWIS